MDDKKKLAAVSAVMAYIRQEEEAACLPAMPIPVAAQAPAPPAKLWSISGRQAQMQFRNLMQAKAFHGYK